MDNKETGCLALFGVFLRSSISLRSELDSAHCDYYHIIHHILIEERTSLFGPNKLVSLFFQGQIFHLGFIPSVGNYSEY